MFIGFSRIIMLGLRIALDQGLRGEVNDMCKATGKIKIQYSNI